MNRHSLVLSVLCLSNLAGTLACSSASPNPGAGAGILGSSGPSSLPSDDGSDAAAVPPESPEASSPIPSAGEGEDAGLPAPTSAPDAALPSPTGMLLAPGSNLVLAGITDDGLVAYLRAGTVATAPLAGGPSTFVKAVRTTPTVKVSGPAVFVWSLPLLPTLGEELEVWTNAHGLVRLTGGVLGTNPIATSADGARAAFFAGTNLMVENLDGTSPIEIGKLCSKALAFDGRGDLVSTDCPAPVGSISAFAAPTLARSFVAAETGYTIDPTGSWVWVVDDDAGGELVQASDGTIAFSDVLATGAAFFNPAGTRLFYVSGDALKSVSIASPGSATTIAASGVESILALSPDGNHLVYKGLTGAFLQATTPGGLAVKLDERIEPAALRGVPTPDMPGKIPTVTYSFTSDSSDVVALTGPIQAGGVPSYRVRPVARNEVLAEGAAESISALAGSKLLVVGPGEDGRVIDVSGASATIDVPGMGAFALSKDRTQIAYVTSEGTEPGLYVVSTSGSGLH